MERSENAVRIVLGSAPGHVLALRSSEIHALGISVALCTCQHRRVNL